MLYITHDLFVIGQICKEVAVMYASNIVEHTSTTELFQKPLHPYTQGLMKSIPKRKERKEVFGPDQRDRLQPAGPAPRLQIPPPV